jgi:hypothetical protein
VDWYIPDGIEPILACRAWGLDDRGPALRSMVQGVAWPADGAMRAECLAPASGPPVQSSHDRTPDVLCRCGIWGLAFPEELRRQADNPWLVYGTVELWGRVVAGTKGWRAEFARPVALLACGPPSAVWNAWWRRRYPAGPDRDELIGAVARRYDLPILRSWPGLTAPPAAGGAPAAA